MVVIVHPALGLLLGAINGGLVVLTRVPDIVVTLAMSFVWAGAALLVLNTPGRRRRRLARDAAGRRRCSPSGSPKALLVLLVVVVARHLDAPAPVASGALLVRGRQRPARRVPERRRRRAAPRSCRTPSTGLFAAMGGLALSVSTGIGTPDRRARTRSLAWRPSCSAVSASRAVAAACWAASSRCSSSAWCART